jgi:hypothetical protein
MSWGRRRGGGGQDFEEAGNWRGEERMMKMEERDRGEG